MSDARPERLYQLIRNVPDFPKPGIQFKDITPLLLDAEGFDECLARMARPFEGGGVDCVVGIEARGFIFGAALASRLKVGFVPVRKPRKLPAEVDRVEYALEYGTDTLEMHKHSLAPGARVLVVDDVIATGGTVAATLELVKKQGGVPVAAVFAIELSFLEGRRKLPPELPIHAVLSY